MYPTDYMLHYPESMPALIECEVLLITFLTETVEFLNDSVQRLICFLVVFIGVGPQQFSFECSMQSST